MDRNQSGNTEQSANLDQGMRLSEILENVGKRLKAGRKIRTPLLLACIGAVLLMLFPKDETVPVFSDQEPVTGHSDELIDEKISRILSEVDGAGNVQVMLTVRSEGETEYQTDRDESTRNGESVIRTTTVFGGNTADSALIRRKTAAEYLGAVVVAEGADRSEVCYMLKLAVSSLTGLPTHKITVLKMK